MGNVWYLFATSGWISWLLILLAIAAIPASLVALAVAFAAPRVGAWLAAAACVFALSIPGAGIAHELWQVAHAKELAAEALAEAQAADDPAEPIVNPEETRLRMEIQIKKEASASTVLGLYVGAPAIALSLAALVTAAQRKRHARFAAAVAEAQPV